MHNFVKSFIVLTLVVMVLVIGFYVFVAKTVITKVGDEKTKFSEMVGEQVILKGDTLMITDYSIIENDLMLESGQSISYELGKKLQLKD